MLVAIAAGLWVVPGDAGAQQAYDDKSTTEGWVWTLVKQGKSANLDEHCEKRGAVAAAAATRDKAEWRDSCRELKPAFLVDILTKTPWRDQLRPAGVGISGAWIKDDIALSHARLQRPLELEDSLVEGDVILEAAQTDSSIAFTRTKLGGAFRADKLRSETSLDLTALEATNGISLSGAKIDGSVIANEAVLDGGLDAKALRLGVNLEMTAASLRNANLSGARVQGDIELRGSTVRGDIDMSNIQAGGVALSSGTYNSLTLLRGNISRAIVMVGVTFTGQANLNSVTAGIVIMRRGTRESRFQEVDLTSARIAHSIDLSEAKVDGPLSLNGASAHDLFMRSSNEGRANFKGVNLVSAIIAGDIEMQGSSFEGDLIATKMRVGGNVKLGLSDENKRKGIDDRLERTSFKALVRLHNSTVVGYMNMEDAAFAKDVLANTLEIGGHLVLCNVVGGQKMDLRFVRVGGNLDASGATFTDLDLAGAYIKGELSLRKHATGRATGWSETPPGELNLRNARAASLMDVPEAWPKRNYLHLDGFTFSRLGERRTPRWWDENWIKLDQQYTPGPYEQIAAALAAAGERSAADDMRFLGRVRQRETERDWGTWLVDLFLEYVAGFGIGDHTFRVLYWVVGITGLGGIYLWWAVPAGRVRGATWCFGAALSRLLPVIEINKEFTDFFNDPKRERLTGFQSAVFSMVGMLGWLLGAILVAAVAGLTQKP